MNNLPVLLRSVLMGALLFLPLGQAMAADDQSAAVIKVLSLEEAILNTDSAQARLKTFREQPDIVGYIQQMDTLKAEYDAAISQLQKDSAVMSAEQQQAAAQSIQAKRDDSEYIARRLQTAQQAVIQAIMQAMQPKVQQVVNDMIESDNIGLLLDAKAALHADSSFNMTAAVTDKLNQ